MIRGEDEHSRPECLSERILDAASKLVSGDRHRQHGDKLINHIAIATLWNGYLNARAVSDRGRGQDLLGPDDVANMMVLLKVARTLNGSHNPDNYVDGAGYMAIAGELAASREAVA